MEIGGEVDRKDEFHAKFPYIRYDTISYLKLHLKKQAPVHVDTNRERKRLDCLIAGRFGAPSSVTVSQSQSLDGIGIRAHHEFVLLISRSTLVDFPLFVCLCGRDGMIVDLGSIHHSHLARIKYRKPRTSYACSNIKDQRQI